MTARTLFLIPARGGSRRIPGKNLRSLGGIPLVGWAARIARAAAARDDLVVCSTDDPAIAAAAATWGASVLDRPADLATDEATSVAVTVHALDVLERAGHELDLLVLVQPTSPLTDPADLAAAVELARRSGRSVTSVGPSHPGSWHQRRDSDGTLHALPVGEDTGLLLTGAFYVVATQTLRAAHRFVEPGVTLGHVVAPERSVDIDEPDDLVHAAAQLRARPVPPLEVGGHRIGDDDGRGGSVFVIAEGGVNHDGDVDVARALIDAASASGADAVKFQTFVPEALAAAGAPTAAYQRDRDGEADQLAMLARLALPADAWAALQAHARSRGITFLSTPFDEASAALLHGLDVPAFKVGSGELTNLPFLVALARRHRPMLVSTGMATMPEVAAAVDAIRGAGLGRLALLHCVSAYPADPADANLAAIGQLRDAFGVQVGWSDHTAGIELPVAAVAVGATIVEKHLTLDRTLRGPDHAMSLEPAAFADMVRTIRATTAALGGHDKAPSAAEREIAAVARRSLHWTRDLPAGTLIEPGHLAARRPGTGVSPARLGDFVGRTTIHHVTAGALVADGDA